MMVIVPVDPDVDKTHDVAAEDRNEWSQTGETCVMCGARSSSTIMVMMMAITPSLNASIRFFSMPMPYNDSLFLLEALRLFSGA